MTWNGSSGEDEATWSSWDRAVAVGARELRRPPGRMAEVSERAGELSSREPRDRDEADGLTGMSTMLSTRRPALAPRLVSGRSPVAFVAGTGRLTACPICPNGSVLGRSAALVLYAVARSVGSRLPLVSSLARGVKPPGSMEGTGHVTRCPQSACARNKDGSVSEVMS
jgi:hypothetical protein